MELHQAVAVVDGEIRHLHHLLHNRLCLPQFRRLVVGMITGVKLRTVGEMQVTIVGKEVIHQEAGLEATATVVVEVTLTVVVEIMPIQVVVLEIMLTLHPPVVVVLAAVTVESTLGKAHE